ncbi:Borealin [Exaiptasia diaphana]|nr:Borealin [Exaiptasia diaphana]
MPRVKRNRETRRKRPAMPEGDAETSMTEDERRQKLDDYLQDFDVQVKSRIEQMKLQAKSIISSIKGAYHLELMKMPPNIRKMKLCDFYGSNRVPFEDKTNAPMSKTPAQSTRKKKAPKTEVAEPQTTGRSLRSTARKRKNVPESPSCKSKAKLQKTEMLAPTTSRRSTRKNARSNIQFVTPACQVRNIAQTPFVTPKFDPSLPVTPALLREPKEGERIMSMSGSPLANIATPAHIAQVLVPIGNGQSLQFTSENSPSQVPRLNQQARKNLELLQSGFRMSGKRTVLYCVRNRTVTKF